MKILKILKLRIQFRVKAYFASTVVSKLKEMWNQQQEHGWERVLWEIIVGDSHFDSFRTALCSTLIHRIFLRFFAVEFESVKHEIRKNLYKCMAYFIKLYIIYIGTSLKQIQATYINRYTLSELIIIIIWWAQLPQASLNRTSLHLCFR